MLRLLPVAPQARDDPHASGCRDRARPTRRVRPADLHRKWVRSRPGLGSGSPRDCQQALARYGRRLPRGRLRRPHPHPSRQGWESAAPTLGWLPRGQAPRVRRSLGRRSAPQVTVWWEAIPRRAILTEAQRALPNETGGVLLGWSTDSDIVITHAVGPGARAEHQPTRFLSLIHIS